MKNANMIGFEREWYTLQNADGHDLVIDGPNFFLTEDIAVEMAQRVCQDYKDTVLVTKNMSTITRAFRAVINTEEVTDTSAVAS